MYYHINYVCRHISIWQFLVCCLARIAPLHLCMACRGLAWPGLARLCLAWIGLLNSDQARPGLARPAWRPMARPGLAWPGLATPDQAWAVEARPGQAQPGPARPGHATPDYIAEYDNFRFI